MRKVGQGEGRYPKTSAPEGPRALEKTGQTGSVSPAQSRPVLDRFVRNTQTGEARGPAPAGSVVATGGSVALWPNAARREVEAHLRALGIGGASDPVDALQAEELRRAQVADGRVSPADMARAVDRSKRAEALVPVAQEDLFGFTAVIDAKFSLTADFVSRLAVDSANPPGGPDQLLAAIDRGPGEGHLAWSRPRTKAELVASLVRQLLLGKGSSLQISLSPELKGWLEEQLRLGEVEVRRALGGAGAFSANLAQAQPNVRASFYAAEGIPPEIDDRLGAQVSVVSSAGEPLDRSKRVDRKAAAKVNYSVEYGDFSDFTLLRRSALKVNGRKVELRAQGSGRVIMSGPEKTAPSLGVLTPSAIRRMASRHQLFFYVGAHRFTQLPREECARKAAELASQLRSIKAANPKILIHHQYVVPKVPAQEITVLRELRGAQDSMSLNSVELPGLLGRLSSGGLAKFKGDPNAGREAAEKVDAMVDGAVSLKESMGLSRVHIHGMAGDVLIQDDVQDPERQVLALMRARQVGAMKAANKSGEIKKSEDLWPTVPVVQGECLAAVYAFADAMTARFGLSGEDARLLKERWWHRDAATGRTYFFVPSRGIHDKTGGTVSLGDTIDATALVYGFGGRTLDRESEK